MIFEEREEAFRWFRQYRPSTESERSFPLHPREVDRLRMGEWFLFRHIEHGEGEGEYYTSRPILGLFIDYSVWDMAMVVNMVEPPRAWWNSHQVITNKERGYGMHIVMMDPVVESFPLWTSNIKVIAKWNHRPSWKELKRELVAEPVRDKSSRYEI